MTQAANQQSSGHAQVAQYSVKQTLSQDAPEAMMIHGGADPNGLYVPPVVPHYVFTREFLRELAGWWQSKHIVFQGLSLVGPPGSGKTKGVTQFCHALNIPMYEVNAEDGMEFKDLVVHHENVGGQWVAQYGPLPLAMGAGGQPGILLINEPNVARPSVLTGLYEVIEGRPLLIPEIGGQVVRSNPEMFGIVVTANTGLSQGDNMGLYPGVQSQSIAFADRFWTIETDYPAPEIEEAILEAVVPQLDETIRKTMVSVANQIRPLFMGAAMADASVAGRLDVTLSTRSLVSWAHGTWLYRGAVNEGINPVFLALDGALLRGQSPETREAVTEIVRNVFGEDK